MKIHNECSFLKPKEIKSIEKLKNAKYVFESCLKSKDGSWLNFPVAIFYTEEAHPQGSNYFALYQDIGVIGTHLMIANGISATTEEFAGLQVGENVIYSRYRHDYRSLGSGFIDGGRDYTRYNPEVGKLVALKVNKDKLEVVA